MAKVAEGMARMTGHRQHSEVAAALKSMARNRRVEVRSLLKSLKASRGSASRLQAMEIGKLTRTRHNDVHSFLAGVQASRSEMGGERRQEAMATISRRRSEVKALLMQFRRELMARRQLSKELAAAQRDKAATFMRDLTGRVAALCEGFAKEDRERAAAIRERAAAVRKRLVAYAQDRRSAVAVWRGSLPEKHAMVASAAATYRPAAVSAVHVEPPVPMSPPAKAEVAQAEVSHRPAPEASAARADPPMAAVHVEAPVASTRPAKPEEPHAAASQSDKQMHRSDQRTIGHGGANKPHGRDSK
jgi:hypothetical protein